MPTNHRGILIEGPRANLQTGGGGGKKPPQKPPTKTGGLPEDPKKHWKDSYGNDLPKRYMTPEDWKKETGNGY
jgi:hypothetical protein